MQKGVERVVDSHLWAFEILCVGVQRRGPMDRTLRELGMQKVAIRSRKNVFRRILLTALLNGYKSNQNRPFHAVCWVLRRKQRSLPLRGFRTQLEKRKCDEIALWSLCQISSADTCRWSLETRLARIAFSDAGDRSFRRGHAQEDAKHIVGEHFAACEIF